MSMFSKKGLTDLAKAGAVAIAAVALAETFGIMPAVRGFAGKLKSMVGLGNGQTAA